MVAYDFVHSEAILLSMKQSFRHITVSPNYFVSSKCNWQVVLLLTIAIYTCLRFMFEESTPIQLLHQSNIFKKWYQFAEISSVNVKVFSVQMLEC